MITFGLTKTTVYKTKTLVLLLAVTAVYELQVFYTNSFLVTENILRVNYQALDSQMIDNLILNRNKYSFLGYLILPLIIVLRCLLFSVPVYIKGVLNAEWKTGFGHLFKIALNGELIFLVYGVLKIVLLSLSNDPSQIANISLFSPLSALSITNYFNLNVAPFTYVFQLINLFELGFWLFMAKSISNYTGKTIGKSLGHVLLSYGMSLLVWAVLVIFLQTLFL